METLADYLGNSLKQKPSWSLNAAQKFPDLQFNDSEIIQRYKNKLIYE